MSRWKLPVMAAAIVIFVGQAGTVMLARSAEKEAGLGISSNSRAMWTTQSM